MLHTFWSFFFANKLWFVWFDILNTTGGKKKAFAENAFWNRNYCFKTKDTITNRRRCNENICIFLFFYNFIRKHTTLISKSRKYRTTFSHLSAWNTVDSPDIPRLPFSVPFSTQSVGFAIKFKWNLNVSNYCKKIYIRYNLPENLKVK